MRQTVEDMQRANVKNISVSKASQEDAKTKGFVHNENLPEGGTERKVISRGCEGKQAADRHDDHQFASLMSDRSPKVASLDGFRCGNASLYHGPQKSERRSRMAGSPIWFNRSEAQIYTMRFRLRRRCWKLEV